MTCCTPRTSLCYAHPSFPHLTWLGSSTREGPDSQPVPDPKPWRDTWGDRAGGQGGEEKRAQSREGQVGRGSPGFRGITPPPMPEKETGVKGGSLATP